MVGWCRKGNRTPDPIITNDVLYQLSYCGLCCAVFRAMASVVAEAPFVNRLVATQGYEFGKTRATEKLVHQFRETAHMLGIPKGRAIAYNRWRCFVQQMRFRRGGSSTVD